MKFFLRRNSLTPFYFRRILCVSAFLVYLFVLCLHKSSQLFVRMSDGWRSSCLPTWFQRQRRISGKSASHGLFLKKSERKPISRVYVLTQIRLFLSFQRYYWHVHPLLQAVLHWRVQVRRWNEGLRSLTVHKHYATHHAHIVFTSTYLICLSLWQQPLFLKQEKEKPLSD